MNTNNTVKYIYIKKDSKVNKDVISIGYKISKDNIVFYTISYCSKNDLFCKKTAQNIINERFKQNNYMNFYIKSTKYRDITKYIINTLKDTKNFYSVRIPMWLKNN